MNQPIKQTQIILTALMLMAFHSSCAPKGKSGENKGEENIATTFSPQEAETATSKQEPAASEVPLINAIKEADKTRSSIPDSNTETTSPPDVPTKTKIANPVKKTATETNNPQTPASEVNAPLTNNKQKIDSPSTTKNPSSSAIGSEQEKRIRLLSCFAKAYENSFTVDKFGNEIQFQDGTVFRWDDGRQKTFDQKLQNGDLEDMFSIPYKVGKMTGVPKVNEDPGRIRVEALFKKLFGENEAQIRKDLVEVAPWDNNVSPKLFISKKFGAAKALTNVSNKLKTLLKKRPEFKKFLVGPIGGTFTYRKVAGTERLSNHSFGTAIDIVVAQSAYWKWDFDKTGKFSYSNKIPQEIIDIFESEKFIWGGKWYHYDTMHFEYRPELFCQNNK